MATPTRDFAAFYREHFDYKAYQQLKLEQLQCVQVHCYPLAEPRFAKFNLLRAELCEKQCNRTMEALEGYQSAAVSTVRERIAGECTTAKDAAKCKTAIYTDAVGELDKAMVTLTTDTN